MFLHSAVRKVEPESVLYSFQYRLNRYGYYTTGMVIIQLLVRIKPEWLLYTWQILVWVKPEWVSYRFQYGLNRNGYCIQHGLNWNGYYIAFSMPVPSHLTFFTPVILLNPQLLSLDLPLQSGNWFDYRKTKTITKIDDQTNSAAFTPGT